MRLNVEVKSKLYKEFWQFAATEGFASISESIRSLMIGYVKRRKVEEGIITLPLEDEGDDRGKINAR